MKYFVQFLIIIVLISCSSKYENSKNSNSYPKYVKGRKVIAIQPFTGFPEKLTNLLASKINLFNSK